MPDKPKVSIAVTVFNMDRYLQQCIRSALCQKTNFEYEIIAADDLSTDNSRKILSDLKDTHPEKIKLIFNEKNLGVKANFMKIVERCEGQYIATMDADDYWIDPLKLQKQADLLDQHPSYSMCSTAAERQTKNKAKKLVLRPWPEKKKSYSLQNILEQNFVVTSSAMFRSSYLKQPPENYYKYPYQDWQLWVHLAREGSIGYIDEVTTVYRHHDECIYGSLSKIKKWNIHIKTNKTRIKHLEPELHPYCYHSIYECNKKLLHAYCDRNNGKKAREYALKSLKLVKYYKNNTFWIRSELLYYSFFYSPKIHGFVYPVFQSFKNSLSRVKTHLMLLN